MIELSRVCFSYEPGCPVLADATVTFGAGCTLVLGPNGAGKSTLLKVAAGVERPDAGSVSIGGHDAWLAEVEARRHLAYVPEQPALSPYASVIETLRLVCRLRGQPLATAEAALEQVGLSAHARRSVRELSMGQRRRAVLAAAFVGTPRYVVLDEPLEAMDRTARHTIVEWVERLVRAQAAMVIATHDLEPVADLADAAVVVANGTVRRCDPLPKARAARLTMLDEIARGVAVP